MKNLLFAALAAMLVFTGCSMNSVLLYNHMAIGRVQNSDIVTDDGLTYVVTENETGSDYTKLGRILVVCDVLEQLGDENLYSVRLTDFASVQVSSPVNRTSESGEWFGDDGINLESGWFSGGYLNVYATISMLQNSTVEHRISLMFDDTADNSDTLHFYLKHNGFGETFDDDPTNSKIGRYSTYVSFPVDSFIPAGAKGANIKLEWDWFRIENNQYVTEKEHCSQSTYYEPGGTRADF